jgi:outer membrane protein insertion porin family
MRKLAVLLIVSCLCAALAVGPTAGAFAADEVIAKVEVIGNDRTDKGVVFNAVKTKAGDVYDAAKIGEDLKLIYKTGFYSDVMVDLKDSQEGKVVTFVVVERPPVSAVFIFGNKKLKTSDIQDKVKVKPGTVLNIEKVKESVEEIRKFYASKGYYAAKVTYEIDTGRAYKAEVRFVVQEPERAYVRKITLRGVKNLKVSRVKGVMRTREKGWFSWMTGSGILDEEALEEDRKQIEAYYHDNGYVRVKVGQPEVKLTPDGKTITITMDVQEGNLYKIGDVDFKGDVIFDKAEMVRKLKSKTGNTFRASLFQADVVTITDFYQDKGYAFVDVAPLTDIEDATRTVNIVHDVAKGSEVYFNRINILGNTRTRDKVVRRELKVAEGDLYSATKLKETKRRLRNTTYFKSEELKTVRTEDPDRVNLDVIVEEKPTGTLSLGVGYSTYEKALVSGSVSQENIFGTGDKVYLTAQISSIAHLYNLTYVQPYTFDKNFSTAYNIFRTERTFDTYDYKGSGGGINVSRPFTDYIRGGLGYRYQSITVYNISSDASSFIQQQRNELHERRVGKPFQEQHR